MKRIWGSPSNIREGVTRLDFEGNPFFDQLVFYNVDHWTMAKVFAYRKLPDPHNPEVPHVNQCF